LQKRLESKNVKNALFPERFERSEQLHLYAIYQGRLRMAVGDDQTTPDILAGFVVRMRCSAGLPVGFTRGVVCFCIFFQQTNRNSVETATVWHSRGWFKR